MITRPDPRLSTAVLASRIVAGGLRRAGRGGGTALPGLIANRIDPRVLDKLAARLPDGVIVVAGTNGKTTTSRMLAQMLETDGRVIAHNRSGSNLVRGVTAALADQVHRAGKRRPTVGVIESDENALPEIVRRTHPRVLLLLNLFRDQLDRYGELETIAAHWRPVIANLPSSTTLIVNADDPNLAALAATTNARVLTFGLNDAGATLDGLPHASDAAICRVCEAPLVYDALFIAHLGAWRCPQCGNARPPLDVSAGQIRVESMERLFMQATRTHGTPQTLDIELTLPGIYNAYNALAALSVASAIGIPDAAVTASLGEFQPAFGRLERVEYHGRTLTLALAKNPTGFNELIRTVASSGWVGPVMIGINDLDADGRDVSWLWDVDFERLADLPNVPHLLTAGMRGDDMAVRMLYAGMPQERIDATAAGRPLADALHHLEQTSHVGDQVMVLLTYTAMLDFRQALAATGAVADFWEQ